MRVVAIANPAAGRKHGIVLRELALPELTRLFPGLEIKETQAPGHGIELAAQSRDADLVIAIGGDGTIREVASGLVSATGPLDHAPTRPLPSFAIIPSGSGNDFPKTAGIPTDVIEACRVAAEGSTRPIDVMKVLMSGPGFSREMHYINAAGFGFDASVVDAARKYKHLRGLPLYLFAVLDAIKSYECPQVRINAPGFHKEQSILLVAAANGRYYGGGMKVAPEAEPDDGLIEVCIGDSMGRLSILRILPMFVAGTHVSRKEVRMLRVPKLELEFSGPVMVQLDGDVIDAAGLRQFHISVLPGAIRLRVPQTPTR